MSALWPELQSRHMKIIRGLRWFPYQKPNKICFALGTIFWVSIFFLYSVQFSCSVMSNPLKCMNGSTPGLPVHHHLLEFTQTHVHRVGDAIQPSHPLSSPSLPSLNLSQQQSFFLMSQSSHEVAKVLEFQLQHQSFQWTPRTDLL